MTKAFDKLKEHVRDIEDWKGQVAQSEKLQIDKKLEGYREGTRFVLDLTKDYIDTEERNKPTKLEDAIEILVKELNEDKSEGSYYYSWQCNIAMAFRDTIPNLDHEQANQAAKRFLDLLIEGN